MIIKRNQHGVPWFGKNYDDLPPIPLINQARAVANRPTQTAFVGNAEALTFAVNDEIHGSQELIHRYKEGTDIYPHVHWVSNGSEGSDKTVNWELEYTIANADAIAPYTSAFPATGTITGETTIPSGTADRSHILTPLDSTISGTGIVIGAYIVFRFRRIASSGTEPAADPFGLAIGFHVAQNTLGSRQLGAK